MWGCLDKFAARARESSFNCRRPLPRQTETLGWSRGRGEQKVTDAANANSNTDGFNLRPPGAGKKTREGFFLSTHECWLQRARSCASARGQSSAVIVAMEALALFKRPGTMAWLDNARAEAKHKEMKRESHGALRNRLRPVFDEFDKDKSGSINKKEMKKVLKKAKLANMTDEKIKALIKEADGDGSGDIDFDEFVECVANQVGEGGFASVLEVTNANELDQISYLEQGDKNLSTAEAFKSRQKLRRNASVLNALDPWWTASIKTARVRRPDATDLNQEDYVCIFVAIYKDLVSAEDEAEAEEETMKSWEEDCKGGETMSRVLLFDSLFELVDIYAKSIEAAEYAELLRSILARIINADGTIGKHKPLPEAPPPEKKSTPAPEMKKPTRTPQEAGPPRKASPAKKSPKKTSKKTVVEELPTEEKTEIKQVKDMGYRVAFGATTRDNEDDSDGRPQSDGPGWVLTRNEKPPDDDMRNFTPKLRQATSMSDMPNFGQSRGATRERTPKKLESAPLLDVATLTPVPTPQAGASRAEVLRSRQSTGLLTDAPQTGAPRAEVLRSRQSTGLLTDADRREMDLLGVAASPRGVLPVRIKRAPTREIDVQWLKRIVATPAATRKALDQRAWKRLLEDSSLSSDPSSPKISKRLLRNAIEVLAPPLAPPLALPLAPPLGGPTVDARRGLIMRVTPKVPTFLVTDLRDAPRSPRSWAQLPPLQAT